MPNAKLIGVTIVLIVLCNSILSHGQERDRRGYVSVGAGPTWLLGSDYDSGVGFQLSLLDAGYEFTHGFGVAATWVGAAFIYDGVTYYFNGSTTQAVPAQFSVGYGMLVVGPMYSLRFGSKSSLDFKARVGRYAFDEKVESDTYNSTSSNTSVAYLVSATYRKNLSPWWTLLGSVDYGSGKKPVTLDTFQRVNSLALTIGIGLRF